MIHSTEVTTTQNTLGPDWDGEVRVATECYSGSCELEHSSWTNPTNPDQKPLIFESVSAQFREPVFDDTAKPIEISVDTFDAAKHTVNKDQPFSVVRIAQSRYNCEVKRVHRSASVFIPAQELVALRDALTKEIRSARQRGLIS